MLRGIAGIMVVGGFFFECMFWDGYSYLSRVDGRTAWFLLIRCLRRPRFHHEHIRACPREEDEDKGPDFEGLRSWASGCAGDVGPNGRFRGR